MTPAAVITGIGVVAPTGTGVEEHWNNTLVGRSGIAPITSFDASGLPITVAGQVAGFDETEWVEHRLIVQTDRWTWLAFAATRLALDDARLDPARQKPTELSVVTASGSGGNLFGQREIQALWQSGPRAVSAYQSIGWFYAASSGQLSILHQLKGACGVLVADGAGGIDAAWQARRLLARGSAGVLVGGTEAPLSPYALVCQSGQRALSRDTDPATAYRPFAADATGHVPGEGGAMMVVEPWQRALDRGARIYAEIAGAASTHDAWHPEDPAPDCRQLARAMREAISRAGCSADDIDVVFADGAGDPRLDRLEADALLAVFGDRKVPVTVPKTMTGRLCSGGAALDLAWAALSIHQGVLPPTVNVPADTVGHGLDLVTEARPADVRHALVVARGVGGFNSAAVLRRPDPETDR
ncbi:ketosynthase chain-length factor [Streptomyces ipomoeae]|jgi:3-oxoacyl-(acyl-carrier-protein) synthase|uniref:Beta-ketoacyl synthase, N-terminal domain protein n=2 Tax=Streptomyces ipomoeae TaxID=103232 RepID=L1L250_9ACTN|nr:beta-ketoacyl synthase N-terminal-like domain-containing protein [Streptomyces ipomoeae]EKX66864.1 beta-ketoacyl synthase, N-terminal domain protein [Streptomyces ipomoeae 91-03]MDX2693201.1 beta-ketoacyl synthase N-terminal-like domain-containing protein [Streptomyces ipomoeae]MDX2820644.1 beta-ketoacyl synthase N-terminal-like domain-containing protein [Streptomyces ipomoeae]MDX2838687.1 beta-ketoacyl synthase N-terminal-like domain-containing protein [Streptomyces ipomoeae]MDX2873152.1 b